MRIEQRLGLLDYRCIGIAVNRDNCKISVSESPRACATNVLYSHFDITFSLLTYQAPNYRFTVGALYFSSSGKLGAVTPDGAPASGR